MKTGRMCAKVAPRLGNVVLRSVTRWRHALILVAAVSLSISVVTRYCTIAQSSPQATTLVKASPLAGKRQHLLNDGFHWSAPIATFVLYEPAGISTAVPQTGSLIARISLEDSLHNRPPPLC